MKRYKDSQKRPHIKNEKLSRHDILKDQDKDEDMLKVDMASNIAKQLQKVQKHYEAYKMPPANKNGRQEANKSALQKEEPYYRQGTEQSKKNTQNIGDLISDRQEIAKWVENRKRANATATATKITNQI